MNIRIIAILIAGLLTCAAVQAGELGMAADAGTLGAGVHLIFPLQDRLSARIGINSYNTNYTGSTTDIDYDFKLKLQTIDALLDWYPMSGGFHLSAGLFHNGNKISSVAKPANGTYTLNGDIYTTAEAGTIEGTIDFRSAAPYLGVGWANTIGKDKRWGFTSDLGVLFQGSPNANLTSSGCMASAQTCAQLYTDLNIENVNLEQKVNNLKYYPVLRIGVTYSF